jgi:2-C-methyl-D-erythritol 2,4-cyclodiphosphate synthase
MQSNLATVLKIKEDAIGITAGTNEKLGYVGEGKGITVYANVLLK